MRQLLNQLTNHQSLTREEAKTALLDLTSGQFNASQAAAFMTVYMMRTITVEELLGFREAMLEGCRKIKFEQPVMDVCGTGGDGKNTFNITTLASFVIAAAGQPVAKHSNYGVSSVCGSSNVLEYLGCRLTNDESILKRSLEQSNLCLLHAPLFHPAMKNIAPYRKELGVKTFFNMLGPLTNPAFPAIQLSGVFSLELARMFGYLLQQTPSQFTILHSLDGYDEATLTAPVKCFSNAGELLLTPSDWNFFSCRPEALHGGNTVEESAQIFTAVLQGNGSREQKEVVVANAALALFTARPKSGFQQALSEAAEALQSGEALRRFKIFLEINK